MGKNKLKNGQYVNITVDSVIKVMFLCEQVGNFRGILERCPWNSLGFHENAGLRYDGKGREEKPRKCCVI